MVAFFLIDFCVPFWANRYDFFFNVWRSRFEAAVGRGILLMGEMLIDELTVWNEVPGLSTGVEVPCCCWERIFQVGADEGPGASWLETVSERVSLSLCVMCVFSDWAAFSGQQNFSILHLLLLYSPTVLHATKVIRRSLGSGGLGRVSVDIAMLLLRIIVFFRLFVLMIVVWRV